MIQWQRADLIAGQNCDIIFDDILWFERLVVGKFIISSDIIRAEVRTWLYTWL